MSRHEKFPEGQGKHRRKALAQLQARIEDFEKNHTMDKGRKRPGSMQGVS